MTRKLTKQQIDAEIQQIHLKSDDEIDFSDIPQTTAKDWAEAERGKFYRPLKQIVTVRLYKDVKRPLSAADLERQLQAIEGITPEEIDTSDIPPLTNEDFKRAVLNPYFKSKKYPLKYFMM